MSLIATDTETNDSQRETSPPGNTDSPSINEALRAINDNMGNMANLLGRIFTHLPSAAQNEDTVLVTDPPGNAMATSRKRRHRRESDASDEDVDRLSVSADSDEDLDSLLGREISGKQSESQKADGSEDDALLNELEASIQDDDKKGPKINEKLAAIAKKRWGRKLAQDKLASLLDKHPQPENCAEIVVPRTNPEIWAQLNSYKRKSDLKLANMQQTVQKATFAVLTLCDKVLALKGEAPSTKEILSDGVNATALLGHVLADLSNLRREQIKPALKSEFHGLCSNEREPSETSQLLFGEDLAKQIRDAKETTKISQTVGTSKHPDRNKSHRRQHNSSWDEKNGRSSGYGKRFLGKRQRQQPYKKKYQGKPKNDGK